eukprot:gene13726-biopygen8045
MMTGVTTEVRTNSQEATWAQSTVQRMNPLQHPPAPPRPAPGPALHAPSNTTPNWQPPSGITNINGYVRDDVVAGVPSGVW